ncbi:29119_t:CDS:1, partial [Racocetra persica]
EELAIQRKNKKRKLDKPDDKQQITFGEIEADNLFYSLFAK